jgi:hypothetical protein
MLRNTLKSCSKLAALLTALGGCAASQHAPLVAGVQTSGYLDAIPCSKQELCEHHNIADKDLAPPFVAVEALTYEGPGAAYRFAVKTARGWSLFALPGYRGATSALYPDVVQTKTVDFALMAEDAKNMLEVRATLTRKADPTCDGEECTEINVRWLCAEDATRMKCEERPWRGDQTEHRSALR